MSITCTITTEFDSEEIQQLFKSELARKHTRSTIELKDGTFTITATDVTALRATVNSITSILSMYEKTQQVNA